MNNIKGMINALRKCAKEHENDVVCTGQIVTSSLCRDVADYLEADRWHYPSRGEYPSKNKQLEEDGKVLCLFNNGSRDVAWYIKTKDKEGWLTACGLEPVQSVRCWQYIVLPKEES